MLINLTPYTIKILANNEGITPGENENEEVLYDTDIVLEPSGNIARIRPAYLPTELDIDNKPIVEISGIGLSVSFGNETDGVAYVVTPTVAAIESSSGRSDILFPADPVYDENGVVTGYKRLSKGLHLL